MKQKLIKKTSLFLLFSFAIAINLFAQTANSEEKIFETFEKNNDIATDYVDNLGIEHIHSGSGKEIPATYYHAGTAMDDGISIMPVKESQLLMIFLTIAYGLFVRNRSRKKHREIKVKS